MERLVVDIMDRFPLTIDLNTNLLECAKKMVRKNTRTLLLVSEKKLVGVLTSKDILWALIKKSKYDLSKIKAMDIASKKIISIKPNATIKEAIEKMKKVKFQRLPVINGGELIGMVTIKEILNFHPELYPEFDELSKIREESNRLNDHDFGNNPNKKFNEGTCDECGNQDVLYSVKGSLICESCKNSI